MAKGVKTGGRKKGTPNKVTGTVREMVSKSISKELESLPYILAELEPKERIDSIIKLMPYILPKAEIKSEMEKQKTGSKTIIENFIANLNEHSRKKTV